jgi:hypothetical protein
MHQRQRLSWLVMAVALLALPQAARAQGRPGSPFGEGPGLGLDMAVPAAETRNQSHRAIENGVHSDDLLDQRLRRLKEMHNIQDLVQKVFTDPKKFGVDPEVFEKLKRDQARSNGKTTVDPNDPQVRKLLEAILAERAKQGQSDLKITPDQAEAWQRQGQRPREEPAPPEPDPGRVSRPPRMAPVTPPALPPPMLPLERPKVEAHGPVTDGEPGEPEAPTNKRQLNPQVAQQLRKLLDKVNNLDPALRHSPALRKAMQSLQQYTPGNDRWSGLAGRVDGLQEGFGDWAGKLRPEMQWPELDWLSTRRLTPRGLPGFNWLSGRGSWMQMPSWEGPTITAPRASGEAVGWGLLWVLVIGGAGVVVWKAMAWRWGEAVRARAAGRLSSWPVHPGLIETAEELIQAFEYLSVLRLGIVARSWNHLAIAAGLTGETATTVEAKLTESLPGTWRAAAERRSGAPCLSWSSDEERMAVAHLAALYERVRYAPPGDPLSDTALAVARRDLCILGGVPAL